MRLTIKSKKILSIFATILIIVFCYETSWLTPPKSWEEASGLNQISDLEKLKFYSPKDAEPKIFWLGHAGFLINWHQENILLDPNLSKTCAIIHRTHTPFIEPKDLPHIDAVILSHMHYDHMDLPTLENIKIIKNLILPKSSDIFLSDKLKSKTNVIGLSIGETTKIGALEITAVKTMHNGARNHAWPSKYFAAGYIISDLKNSIYFAGDTGFGDHFKEIKELYSPTISILPIGSYEPYDILHKYHLNPEDAVKAGKILGSEILIPGHFGTFRIAFDRPNTAIPKLNEIANKQNLNWQLAQPISKRILSELENN